MRHVRTLAAIVGLLIIGAVVSTREPSVSSRPLQEQSKPQQATVPSGVSFVAQPEPANRQTIGHWRDERPLFAGHITIIREEGKLFVERKFKDGSSLKKEVVEKKSPLGRRFDYVEGSTYGDHYVLRPNGDLQIRDTEGLITIAKKMK